MLALTVSGDGTVFVADYWNNTIRQGAPLLPVLGLPQVSGGLVRLNWTVVSGQQYQLQSNADLTSAKWSNVGDVITATNGMGSTEDNVFGNTQRFYRVLLLP